MSADLPNLKGKGNMKVYFVELDDSNELMEIPDREATLEDLNLAANDDQNTGKWTDCSFR